MFMFLNEIGLFTNNFWGLGIGDWGLQSPIPNPQSPIPKLLNKNEKL